MVTDTDSIGQTPSSLERYLVNSRSSTKLQTTCCKMLSFRSWCTCKMTVLFLRVKRFIDRSVGAYFFGIPCTYKGEDAANYTGLTSVFAEAINRIEFGLSLSTILFLDIYFIMEQSSDASNLISVRSHEIGVGDNAACVVIRSITDEDQWRKSITLWPMAFSSNSAERWSQSYARWQRI